MLQHHVSEPSELARKLLSFKGRIAQAITDEFFQNHPDWDVRYGERGRRLGIEDAGFHMEYLAGAIEAGSTGAFVGYARWTTRMLGARGIAAHSVEENLAQLERHISPLLLPLEREAVQPYLTLGRQACVEVETSCGTEQASDVLGETREVFLAAILSGQRQAALKIVDEALRAGNTHLDLYVDVFTKSLRRVGELWEANEISVAQEHIATAITQYAVAAVYERLSPSVNDRGSIVVTGVAGELHQVGANLVADALEAEGWTVRFLGSNLPHSAIISAIREVSADFLGISTSLIANLSSVVELVHAVRSEFGERAPKIVLGGPAYRFAPDFAQKVGAIGAFTDLRQALVALTA